MKFPYLDKRSQLIWPAWKNTLPRQPRSHLRELSKVQLLDPPVQQDQNKLWKFENNCWSSATFQNCWEMVICDAFCSGAPVDIVGTTKLAEFKRVVRWKFTAGGPQLCYFVHLSNWIFFIWRFSCWLCSASIDSSKNDNTSKMLLMSLEMKCNARSLPNPVYME